MKSGSMMVAILAISTLLASCTTRAGAESIHHPLSVSSLRVENAENPLGIDAARPRLSWQLRSTARDVRQSAYQVRVALKDSDLRRGSRLLFDSGKVTSDQSTQLTYAGPDLQPRQRYVWQVRVWDQHGKRSPWSEPAWWEMALLDSSQWTANWIESAASRDGGAMLRRAFKIHGDVTRARVYVTSRGLYQLFLNGQRVGNAELTPGWTSYNKRLQYQTYDVTSLLKDHENAVGALLGSGWFSGEIGFAARRNVYGRGSALLMQLEVVYKDGRVERVVTDDSWRTSTGPIVTSSLFAGETYDARLEQAGWSEAGFDDRSWTVVKVSSQSKETLVAQRGPPVRKMIELKPRSIMPAAGGKMLVDMGQNMVGWVRLAVSGPAGTTVTLRHGEILDADGSLYTKNLRTAKQTVRYTLKGSGLEIYQPHFTFQGFRYVELDGYPGELKPQDITGVVLYSDMRAVGEFVSSNPLLNQLQSNIVWGQRGNFVDVPTDCPQRDERLGWTGDAQVFAATAAFNADVSGFFAKWLKDLAADQYDNGSVPFVVPDIIPDMNTQVFTRAPESIRRIGKIRAAGAAGWGDAATIIPWAMYLAYGDRQVLQEQYASMKLWVEYERERAGEDLIWDGDFHFGDWLDFGSAERGNFGATEERLIATAYFAHSARLLSQAAAVLGERGDAARYATLFDEVRSAFQRTFVSGDGKVGSGTQTAQVLALQFDLLPGTLRAGAAKLLAQDVRQQGHLTTGFLGTPGLLFALSEHGHLDLAYELLNRDEYPSWLYPVKQGATTIWERWDGVKPDGSLQTPDMNSFNHYAYGAVGEWMYRVVAGINVDNNIPGYKHILIKPRPGGGLTQVRGRHDTPYGAVASAWSIDKGSLHLEVEIPPNTTASVSLPATRKEFILENGKRVTPGNGVHSIEQAGDNVLIEIGSGRYEFIQPWR